jgi:hypothetical protein
VSAAVVNGAAAGRSDRHPPTAISVITVITPNAAKLLPL